MSQLGVDEPRSVEESAEPGVAGPTLRGIGMRKGFGGIEVLHGVDLELRAGEVHALVGENGAGKSTIINLLSGRLRPDAGQIELDGTPVEFRNPLAARRSGISVIAQELEVVPTLTIVENVFLGAEPTKYGLIRWGDARRQVVSILRELGVAADPDRVVGTMNVADQQLVEIAKAVVGQFRVLIMDEPTSALNLEDTERLFKIVRRLKANGVAILYVSHRLWEVFDLADRVTVLRDGSRIMMTEIAETDVDTVIRAMLGSKSSLIAGASRSRRGALGVIKECHAGFGAGGRRVGGLVAGHQPACRPGRRHRACRRARLRKNRIVGGDLRPPQDRCGCGSAARDADEPAGAEGGPGASRVPVAGRSKVRGHLRAPRRA